MAADIAKASALMVLNRPAWVHRRVEQIVFLGDNRILRRVSIDFTVPDFDGIVICPDGIQRLVYVPLSMLGKSVLEKFDLRDEAGEALSALGQREHNLIARRMLRGVARAAAGEGQQLDPELADELDALVTSEARRGEEIRTRWGELAGFDPAGQRATIWEDPSARALMSDLSHLFILFVPMAVEPGARRVVKFSFEEEFHGKRVRDRGHAKPSVPGGSRALPFMLRFRREKPFPFELRRTRSQRAVGGRALAEGPGLRQRVARSLFSDSRTFQFGVPIGGQAASCHIELPAPEDLLIASCNLERVSPEGPQEIGELRRATELAHLHPGPQPRDALTILTVRFALRASGVLSAAALISMLSSLMLLGGVLLHLAGVPVRADAAGAVVVVAPAVFAPFIAVSASHRLVRRIVRGLRILMVGVAAITFGAAASLVASFPHSERRWIWLGLFVLSLVPTGVLSVRCWQAARMEQKALL